MNAQLSSHLCGYSKTFSNVKRDSIIYVYVNKDFDHINLLYKANY